MPDTRANRAHRSGPGTTRHGQVAFALRPWCIGIKGGAPTQTLSRRAKQVLAQLRRKTRRLRRRTTTKPALLAPTLCSQGAAPLGHNDRTTTPHRSAGSLHAVARRLSAVNVGRHAARIADVGKHAAAKTGTSNVGSRQLTRLPRRSTASPSESSEESQRARTSRAPTCRNAGASDVCSALVRTGRPDRDHLRRRFRRTLVRDAMQGRLRWCRNSVATSLLRGAQPVGRTTRLNGADRDRLNTGQARPRSNGRGDPLHASAGSASKLNGRRSQLRNCFNSAEEKLPAGFRA